MARRRIVMNDFGAAQRSSSAGFSATITATPLVHTFDPLELGRKPAAAIAKHLSKRIESLPVQAAPATIEKRRGAAVALARGSRSAQRRYPHGAPSSVSTRLFVDTGYLADEAIRAVAAAGDAWEVAVAERFEASKFPGGAAAVREMLSRLRVLVPEWGDAAQLARQPQVRAAIAESLDQIIERGR